MRKFSFIKPIIPFLILACTAFSMQAQKIVAKNNYIKWGGTLDASDVVYYTHIYNVSSDTLWLSWKRNLNDLPAPDWSSAVCIGALCYSTTTSQGNFIESLLPGDSSLISCYFYKDGTTSGTAKMIVDIYNSQDSLNVNSRITFEFTTWPVGIEQQEQLEFEMYPNPVMDEISLKHDLNSITANIVIYDLLGNQIYMQPIGINQTISRMDVSYLTPGIYILAIQNKQGKLLGVKRFNKL
jgi:Secretion system C-terminal sorting domain